MSDRPSDPGPAPIPGDWLPEPSPPEGSPTWKATVARVMAAADHELAMRGSSEGPAQISPWLVLGQWWKPAAALAAAATGLLLFVDRPAPAPASVSSLSLIVVAAEGDPQAIWGVTDAHPVLALLAAEPVAQENR
jgi:hypothetical protein